MKKVLFVTHNGRFLVQFELNDIRILQEMGYEVHCATNFKNETMRTDAEKTLVEHGVICHQIEIARSPLNVKENIKAYRQLRELMYDKKFDGVHCHTPMGGVIGRLAAEATKTKHVLYTAHGFHFYEGCSLKNRLFYQTTETFLARYTDAQITINHEDFEAAKKFPLRGKAYYVPGIGVKVKELANKKVEREKIRKELDVPRDSYVFISVGELNENKNHATVIRAFAKAGIPNSYYLICGEGKLKNKHLELAKKLGVADRVKLLGFRTDVEEILKACDSFVFPSIREGLSVSLMEAMAAGLPCIASRIRGNVDLLAESRYLFDPTDEEKICRLMKEAAEGIGVDEERLKNESTMKLYDIQNVSGCMAEIYKTVLGKNHQTEA